MGLLVDGHWRDDSHDPARMQGGRFNRPSTKFRNWVTPDGSQGPSGEGGFPAEADRYHLYVSLACPWAHRTIIFRHLKRLENVISMSVTSWHMAEFGWTFDRHLIDIAVKVDGHLHRLDDLHVFGADDELRPGAAAQFAAPHDAEDAGRPAEMTGEFDDELFADGHLFGVEKAEAGDGDVAD